MRRFRSTPAEADNADPGWADLFRNEYALSSVLVVLGASLYALNVLVIAIIMPTVIADIGGATYYTWPAMLYTVGSIVGAASLGPLWRALGARRGYAVSGLGFLIGTAGCALAPDMGALIVARGIQGFAGGLVIGGVMALVSGLFGEALRTRILALYQGTWMVAQLLGPVVGGAFAQIGWWRGSFWVMAPVVLGFVILAWLKLPDRLNEDEGRGGAEGFPFARIGLLAAGVFCFASAGPIDDAIPRLAAAVTGIGLVWCTFRLDRKAENRLYPLSALSLGSPIGLALWILFLVGMVQTTVTLFLPLLLQVVHGVAPLFISFVSIVISLGWTVGTFLVSGWSDARQRLALWGGPLLMIAGLAVITATTQLPMLAVLTLAAFVFGFGIGTHNVHLVARSMAAADKGEERITASAMPSFRMLGTAAGAAMAGMLSNMAGLGDAIEPGTVGAAVTLVYGFNLLPLAFAALFMFWLLRLGARPTRSGRAAAPRE